MQGTDSQGSPEIGRTGVVRFIQLEFIGARRFKRTGEREKDRQTDRKKRGRERGKERERDTHRERRKDRD